MSEAISYVIAAAAVAAFGLAIFWPRRGVLARLRRMHQAGRRALVEDALKHLHACEWRGGAASLPSLAGALQLPWPNTIRLVEQMEAQGWLRSSADGLHLTADGEQLAVAVIRAHRLWERYLADEARMPLTHIHAEAERREHDRSAEVLRAMEAAMGHPASDPHGDPIPTVGGELRRTSARPITDWPLNTPARIVHIEDEPPAIYSQIVAEGLSPGQVVRVVEAGAQRLLLSDGERVHTLAPLVAANIFVAADEMVKRPAVTRRLTALRRGQEAVVHELDSSLQGFTRRRLLDLGLTPGAAVTAELPGLFGDPVAYRVRGTLIALRREQADQVLIQLTDRQRDMA